MGISQPVLGYPTKQAAAYALHLQGMDPEDIAKQIGSTVGAVKYSIRAERSKAPPQPTEIARSQWTEGKVEKAVRLFVACVYEVAGALDVPSDELQALWVKGRQPALPVATPEPDRDDDEAELARLAAEADAEVATQRELISQQQPLPREAFEGPDTDEVPVAVARFQPPADPVPRPMAPAPLTLASGLFPAGQIVRLKREDGQYLHESLDGFTKDRKWAWDGDRRQFDAVKAQMPKVVAKLIFEVVLAP